MPHNNHYSNIVHVPNISYLCRRWNNKCAFQLGEPFLHHLHYVITPFDNYTVPISIWIWNSSINIFNIFGRNLIKIRISYSRMTHTQPYRPTLTAIAMIQIADKRTFSYWSLVLLSPNTKCKSFISNIYKGDRLVHHNNIYCCVIQVRFMPPVVQSVSVSS